MKPVAQTRFGLGEGNCFQACVASVLELELEQVPDFMQDPGDWIESFRRWVRSLELDVLVYLFETPTGLVNSRTTAATLLQSMTSIDAPWIVCGAHYTGMHACVYRGGRLEHDPNPTHGSEGLESLAVAFLLLGDVARARKTPRRRSITETLAALGDEVRASLTNGVYAVTPLDQDGNAINYTGFKVQRGAFRWVSDERFANDEEIRFPECAGGECAVHFALVAGLTIPIRPVVHISLGASLYFAPRKLEVLFDLAPSSVMPHGNELELELLRRALGYDDELDELPESER